MFYELTAKGAMETVSWYANASHESTTLKSHTKKKYKYTLSTLIMAEYMIWRRRIVE